MYEPIEQILKAANRSAALTGQLLAYGRKQPLHPQILDLNQMLQEMAEPIRKLLGDHDPAVDPDRRATWGRSASIRCRCSRRS